MTDTKKHKRKLINYGGEGCIFVPQLPCDKKTKHTKKSKRKNKRKTKRKTKLLFRNIPSTEGKISNMIMKRSNNYSEWCFLWDSNCMSEDYKHLKKISEVEKCFLKKKRKIPNERSKFKLLQGDYVGITSTDYYKVIFNKSVVENFNKFKTAFYKMIHSMRSLFMGLIELQKIDICHNDIKVDNIIYNDKSLYYIDFGLAFTFRNSKSVISRMKKEFNSGRIYESYPFEYIYYPKLTKEEINREITDISYEDRPMNYIFTEYIHERLFARNMNNIRIKILKDKLNDKNKPELEPLVKKIDVYSLGMFPLMILIEACDNNDIDINTVIRILKLKEFKETIDLLRDMTKQDYRDRISAEEACERYLNLIKEL
uniref:Protein kinase domain-containing protein n=1 Tax=viral metagenome TaxID=1070528 RepID=A0A6C0FD39_9ZZZZ|tara:strand:- start:2806 stop:3915 length:1110 start_codon:yes stop_codon:yes gene_type:complete